MLREAPDHASFTDVDYICIAADLLAEMMSELESLNAANRGHAVAMAAVANDVRQKLRKLLRTVEQLTSTQDPIRGAELSKRAKALILALATEMEESAAFPERDYRQFSPSPYCFEICSLLGQLKIDWQPVAAGKQLKLDVSVVDCLVQSDQRLLAVILNNLVGNAVTHTARGGVTLASIVAGSSLILMICDTGPGISDEDLRRSFNFSSSYGQLNGDLGLRLSIAREIAKMLGHEFDISTGMNFGTCIRLHVPLAVGQEYNLSTQGPPQAWASL